MILKFESMSLPRRVTISTEMRMTIIITKITTRTKKKFIGFRKEILTDKITQDIINMLFNYCAENIGLLKQDRLAYFNQTCNHLWQFTFCSMPNLQNP